MPHVVDVPPRASSTVTHVIPRPSRITPNGDHYVTGLTSLGDDVFVFTTRCQCPQVDVYSAVTFTLRRCLPIPGPAFHSYGLAACAYNSCLYASDADNGRVHRVALSAGDVTQWPVAGGPMDLTVNGDRNVLVVVQDECKLQEFTTHGTLLQTIRLDLEKPRSVLQLSSGQFVVSHSTDTLHRVCLLDDKGAVVRSYGSTAGSDLTKMNCPSGLAVDKHGNILVADYMNHRLLVLDPSLTSAREMAVPVYMEQPRGLCFDETCGRLLIDEIGAGRVIIVDHLKDFTAPETP